MLKGLLRQATPHSNEVILAQIHQKTSSKQCIHFNRLVERNQENSPRNIYCT